MDPSVCSTYQDPCNHSRYYLVRRITYQEFMSKSKLIKKLESGSENLYVHFHRAIYSKNHTEVFVKSFLILHFIQTKTREKTENH